MADLLVGLACASSVPVDAALQALFCLASGAHEPRLALVQFNALAAVGAELEEARLMGHAQRLCLQVGLKGGRRGRGR